jgi:hypothetical protein
VAQVRSPGLRSNMKGWLWRWATGLQSLLTSEPGHEGRTVLLTLGVHGRGGPPLGRVGQVERLVQLAFDGLRHRDELRLSIEYARHSLTGSSPRIWRSARLGQGDAQKPDDRSQRSTHLNLEFPSLPAEASEGTSSLSVHQ